jgi:hypothetical protein
MELYKVIKNIGDMRLNINGYEIAVLSELICRYSKTLKMIKERDGLDKVIDIKLCDIVKLHHVDALFCNLYQLDDDNKKIRKRQFVKLAEDISKKTNEPKTISMLALDLLIDYLCIDIISMFRYQWDSDDYNPNILSEFLVKTPYYYNGIDNCNTIAALKTCEFIKRMYQYDNQNRGTPLWKVYDENDTDINDWYELYEEVRAMMPIPQCIPMSDKALYSRDIMNAASSSIRASGYICDILKDADAPAVERIALWYNIIINADANVKKHMKIFIDSRLQN